MKRRFSLGPVLVLPLAIAAVLMLLAYAFRYGQALQQQADETL